MSDINPRDFGALEAKVASLEAAVDRQGAAMEKQGEKIDQLLELANKSRGAMWTGMALASFFGGIFGFLSDHLMRR